LTNSGLSVTLEVEVFMLSTLLCINQPITLAQTTALTEKCMSFQRKPEGKYRSKIRYS